MTLVLSYGQKVVLHHGDADPNQQNLMKIDSKF